MFVCLCTGVTTQVVDEVVAAGASTSKQIADACGAGGDCGRCRRTIRAILAAHKLERELACASGNPIHGGATAVRR